MDTDTAPQQKRTSWGHWWEHNLKYTFVAPTVFLILAISLFPLLYSLGISFLQWDLQRPGRKFIFLENYANALTDSRLWESLGHTLIIIVIAVSLELLIGLTLALALSGRLPGKRFIIPLLILPVVIAPIIVGFTWRMLWDTQFGPVNQVLGWIAQRPVNLIWLSNPKSVYPAILLTEVWQWTPFIFLILLAGLAAVNPELGQAAAIDGASASQIFRYITLPLIRPVIVIAVLFRALDVFKLFDIIFALTGGGPGTLTETTSLYVYTIGFKNFRLGYTAAVSFIVLIVVVVLITILWRQLGEREEAQ